MPLLPVRRPAWAPRRAALAWAAAAALVAPLLLPATPASAGVVQEGKVVFVADGDTFDVDVIGDGTSKPMRVRSIGVNTMELSVYSHDIRKIRGACHATEAARRLHRLIFGKRVRLTSRFFHTGGGARYRRSVDVRIDGVWRDVHAMMMREGHALFLGNLNEYRKNRKYMIAAQRAKIAGKNLWDPDYCGAGPTATLSMRVQPDPPGSDIRHLNGEYFKITNHGTNTVSLAGWHVRDGGPTRYVFPRGATVAPGTSTYVHVGSGTNRTGHFYWGRGGPLFDNVSGAPTYKADGGYLFDPRGNLRASDMYPCYVACS